MNFLIFEKDLNNCRHYIYRIKQTILSEKQTLALRPSPRIQQHDSCTHLVTMSWAQLSALARLLENATGRSGASSATSLEHHEMRGTAGNIWPVSPERQDRRGLGPGAAPPSLKHFQRNQHQLDEAPARTSRLKPQHYTLNSACSY